MIDYRHLAIGIFALLTACGTSAPVPEDRFYQLDVLSPGIVQQSPVLKGGLTIERVSADPMRGGRAILYRSAGTPLELRRYHYEFWVDAPPPMIGRLLAAYLVDSGVADPVRYQDSQRMETKYRLETRLERFEYLVGGPFSGFEIALETKLYLVGSGDVLWSKIYRERQDAPEGDMHEVAKAAQQALQAIFHSLAADFTSIDAKS